MQPDGSDSENTSRYLKSSSPCERYLSRRRCLIICRAKFCCRYRPSSVDRESETNPDTVDWRAHDYSNIIQSNGIQSVHS